MKKKTARRQATPKQAPPPREINADEVNARALDAGATLDAFDDEEQKHIAYPILAKLRREAWAKHAIVAGASDGVKDWAGIMAGVYGSTVQVGFQRLPWVEALAVVRYGEAQASWPKKFTLADMERAVRWAEGATPNGVKYDLIRKGA